MSTNGFESFHPEWDPRRPGTFIQRELDVTGTTQAELADRMSVSKKHLNQVIKAGASITPDFALALERALGVPARLLLRMEADWRAAQLTRDARAGLAPHLSWLRNFSADSLTQNRIVDSGDDDLDRVEKLLRFFGVSDPSAFDRV